MFSLSFGDRCYEQPPAGSPIWVCHSWGQPSRGEWMICWGWCRIYYYRQTYRWSSLNHCADITLEDDCNLHTTCCIQLRYFVGLGLWTVYCSPKNLWTSDSTQLSAFRHGDLARLSHFGGPVMSASRHRCFMSPRHEHQNDDSVDVYTCI